MRTINQRFGNSINHAIRRLICWVAMAIFIGITSALAQSPKIEVAVSADDLFIGESLDFQVEVKNAEKPNPPDVAPLKEVFDVEFAGDQSRNQSSTMIINGRVSTKNVFSHIYLYRLKPKQAGVLTIPSITTKVDGKTLTSNEITIQVQSPEKQDVVLVDLKSNLDEVFPTQSFTVTLRILVKPIPQSNADPLSATRKRSPHIQLDWVDPPEGLSCEDKSDWLRSMLSKKGSGFAINEFSTQSGSLFDSPRAAVFDLLVGHEKRKDDEGEETQYFVYEVARTFTANKTGNYSFGPALVKGTFVAGLSGTELLGQRIVAASPVINVVVRDVPTPRPVNFIGGIGDYRVKATAKPLKLRVGDPLTLTVEFARGKSAGSLEMISAPDLSAIPEVVADFDIIDSKPTGRIENDNKAFGYSIRPKRPGVSLPAIPLSIFDPISKDFNEISTPPIALTVEEASRVSSSEIVGAIAQNNSTGIKQSAAGIFQNVTDPSLIRDERSNVWNGIMTVIGCWSLALIGIVIVRSVRSRSGDTVRLRRQQATRVATGRLSRAQQLNDSKAALSEIRAAIVGLVADTRNLIADGLTINDVKYAMQQFGVTTEDQDAMQRLLNTIEAAEYGAGDRVDTASLIEQAKTLVGRLGPVLGRSAR